MFDAFPFVLHKAVADDCSSYFFELDLPPRLMLTVALLLTKSCLRLNFQLPVTTVNNFIARLKWGLFKNLFWGFESSVCVWLSPSISSLPILYSFNDGVWDLRGSTSLVFLVRQKMWKFSELYKFVVRFVNFLTDAHNVKHFW